jgi:hypothetical protein
MRYLHTLLSLAAACALVGCQRELPTGPTAEALAIGGPSLSAVQDWERRTIFNDHTFFVPCLNEDARIYGYVSYQLHEVSTPSGGYDFMIQYLPSKPGDPPFVLEGLTSGKTFYYANGRPVNVSFHSAAGETQTVVVNEKYVAADGSAILGDQTFHYTVNANGELVDSQSVEYHFTCVK